MQITRDIDVFSDLEKGSYRYGIEHKTRGEGMVAETKSKKKILSFWYSIQGPGQMAKETKDGVGDSASRFRCSRC